MENILNVEISKPHQELIIMTGIPGSGKSTSAKNLVKSGVIHSTDEVIGSICDYSDFFSKMNESGDLVELNKAHSLNLKNAIKSMKDGVSPVIIDNTNISPSESRAYVISALEMGFDDKNITICDIGLGGLTAKALAERNTHGVSLIKIESMIQKYKSVKGLTLLKIINAKPKGSDISYSCVLLDSASRTHLLEKAGWLIPAGWIIVSEHMTIRLGPLKDKSRLGEEVTLEVNKIGLSDMAIAVIVDGYESKNDIPHITIAINPEGGKRRDSNDITKWQDIKSFNVKGVVSEIKPK